MGSKSSKETKPCTSTSVTNTPRRDNAPVPCSCSSEAPQKKLDRKYSRIRNGYKSLEQVSSALDRAGLESSNLIIGIDFTKSNEGKGTRSFNRRCLHSIGESQNPYEQAISIIGQTLSRFDEDNLIPCFGFGDASTHDQSVFSFYPDSSYCHGFEDVLRRYREIVPQLRLAGPTSFVPVIEMAMKIVEESGGQYHILLIIADGQVTRSGDTKRGQLSSQEQKTIDAIVKASNYPLSIILVGVGDGPWNMMKRFDDNIPSRAFDNFQFVNFTDIMSKNVDVLTKQTKFALTALMEIPLQYKATLKLSLLGTRTGNAPNPVPLPPPCGTHPEFMNPIPPSAPHYHPSMSSTYDNASTPPPCGTHSEFMNPIPPSAPHYHPSMSSTYDNVSTPPPCGTHSEFMNPIPPSAPHYHPSMSSTYDNVCPMCLGNRGGIGFGLWTSAKF